jgi:HK97 family phage prohead protease
MRNFCAPSYQTPSATRYAEHGKRPVRYSVFDCWSGTLLERQFNATAMVPSTYDAESHEVDAIITSGRVQRSFGTAVFRIGWNAVDTSLLDQGRIPLLDSHNHDCVVGRVTHVWFEDQQLHGTLHFDRTPEGRHAESLVARGEITGVSAGLTVKRWTAKDKDGEMLNPEFTSWGEGDGNVFTATRWRLDEVSLTTMPGDPLAVIL